MRGKQHVRAEIINRQNTIITIKAWRETPGRVFLIMFLFLLSLLAGPLLMSSTPFIQVTSARTREFEQNITIPANDMQALELVFGEGDELELIFSLEVKQDLSIDIWFVNYANYVRLMDGNEFQFFIDGSQQEIKQVQKVVTVTLYDSYSLVLANYNNQSVDVYLTYDINLYPQEEDTTSDGSDKEASIPLWKEFYVMLPLGLIIGILVGLFASRVAGRSGESAPEATAKVPSKKAKARKPKKAKAKANEKAKVRKTKMEESVVTKKIPAKDAEVLEPKKEEPEAITKAPAKEAEEPRAVEKVPSSRFCGHCGKPVTTPFCTICGRKVEIT